MAALILSGLQSGPVAKLQKVPSFPIISSIEKLLSYQTGCMREPHAQERSTAPRKGPNPVLTVAIVECFDPSVEDRSSQFFDRTFPPDAAGQSRWFRCCGLQ
jgi:hypothetical protein